MMLKMKSFGLIAGCTLAAGALYAAYNENFENTNTWTGDGTVTETTYQYSGLAGLPLSGTHAKVLLVEGDSLYTATSETTFPGTPLVDMMVQAALPDDELETPGADAHIAVAVDTNGIFNVYCKNRSDVPAWYPLSSKVYADGTWVRVSLLFDYANKRCQVRIDGEPMMTANGYLDATTTDTTKNGAWYKLVAADTTSETAVSKLQVVGCTAVDDVVIAENASSYAVTAGAKTESDISCAWLDTYGLGWDATTAAASYDNSGLTVAQKYNACLSPFDDQTFVVKSVKATSSNIMVGIPKTVATTGRKVVLEYGSTTTMGNEVDVTPGETSVPIDLPSDGEVKYFRLKAKATASN